MAHYVVDTTPEERQKVLEAIKEIEGKTTPVSAIARLAGLSESRTRYSIIDLIDEGKIQRIPTKAFNTHYIRYSYKIL